MSEKIPGEALIILHVEDNLSHAELVRRSLLDHRVANSIQLVEDGEKALDYLHHRGEFTDPETYPRPTLILLDLHLPKVDGLEVLKDIKCSEDLSMIPVVILTTSAAEKDVAKAYELHANGYLVKPLEFSKFDQLLEELAYSWLAWNKFPTHKARVNLGA